MSEPARSNTPQQQGCSLPNLLGCLTIPAGIFLGTRAGYHLGGIAGGALGAVAGAVAGAITIPVFVLILLVVIETAQLAERLAGKLRRGGRP